MKYILILLQIGFINLMSAQDTLKTTQKSTKEVVITDKKKEGANIIGKEVIDQCELGKLACCNLAESFENSNTVDVVYSDGVMGGREIQMLGLNGMYSQQLWEGLPYHRGLTQKLGLELVPGIWIENIGVNKGIGSVANGFENISGQINIDFKRPRTTEKLIVNGYISEVAKSDFNFITGLKLSERLATNFFGHTSFSRIKFDNNHDNFIDMPLFWNFNFMNKWHYIGKNGFVLNAAVQVAKNDVKAGELSNHHFTPNPYIINQNTEELQLMLKTAWDINSEKSRSFALTYRFNLATQDGNYGKNIINSKQVFGNVMAIYQSNIFNDHHLFKMGYSYHMDLLDENIGALNFTKREHINGIFIENTYNSPNKDLKIITGIRGDLHNELGFFISPRVDVTFSPSDNHTLKLTSGLGFRTPAMLSEMQGFLISNRNVQIPGSLEAEKAWNSGFVYRFNYKLFNRFKSSFEASYFMTLFQNQLIFNVEEPQLLTASYLKDNSKAQNIQFENIIYFNDFINLKLSYRSDYTTAIFNGEKKMVPLIKTDKFLANLSMNSSNQKWRWSNTILLNGPSRIPNTGNVMPQNSPWFAMWHSQINFIPSEKFDIYLGAENIFNYMQQNRIVSWQNSSDSRFDGGMIWGPMDGRRIYIGAKFLIK